MLVLTRKSNQSIMIGDEIEISVRSRSWEKRSTSESSTHGPVPVFRREVYVEIRGMRTARTTPEETTRAASAGEASPTSRT